MASDKEKIAKGIRFLAFALPLIFTGPGLYVAIGVDASRQGNHLWSIISVGLMIIAVVLVVLGLRMVLRGFFQDSDT